MMISRSGDILEISTSMYLYFFLLKYARSASYQHNTTYTVLESFIISCWLLKGKKIGIGIGIGQFA